MSDRGVSPRRRFDAHLPCRLPAMGGVEPVAKRGQRVGGRGSPAGPRLARGSMKMAGGGVAREFERDRWGRWHNQEGSAAVSGPT
jgi:hypothetical protein